MEDPLDNRIEISVALEETGVSVHTKSRAVAAFDRLLGNVLDFPNSYLERHTSFRRANTAARITVIRAIGTAAAEAAGDNGELARALVEKTASEQFRKLEVRENIAVKAVEHLNEASENEEQTPTTEEVSGDWMNAFIDFADRSSSESLQDMWAKVLAGEIIKPGAFSLPTLRVIAELDKDIANLFEEQLIYTNDDTLLILPKPLVGKGLMNIRRLEEYGLISGMNSSLGITLTVPSSGVLTIENGYFRLIIKGSPNTKLRIDAVMFTIVGLQLKQIIPWRRGPELLEAVATHIQGIGGKNSVDIIDTRTGQSVRKARPAAKSKTTK